MLFLVMLTVPALYCESAVYSVLTDGKCHKLQAEWSSLESIHHLLHVLTKRMFISVKTIILVLSFLKKSAKKV